MLPSSPTTRFRGRSTPPTARSGFKIGVQALARMQDQLATFMAKPFNDDGGSGFHLHLRPPPTRGPPPRSWPAANELDRFDHWVTDWEFREYSYHL